MWTLVFTKQFKKDFKLCKKRGLPDTEIETITRKLQQGIALAERHREHVLKGEYHGFSECHIRPDWLLIYSKDEPSKTITFIRTGTHSDLFD